MTHVNDVIVEIHTNAGVGYGKAPSTGVITGDTRGSVRGAIEEHIRPASLGREVDEFEDLMRRLNSCIVEHSAKAAVDMALGFGRLHHIPGLQTSGGKQEADLPQTLNDVNNPEQMAEDARQAVKRGYDCLKIKVGVNPALDVERITAVRQAAGADVSMQSTRTRHGRRNRQSVF